MSQITLFVLSLIFAATAIAAPVPEVKITPKPPPVYKSGGETPKPADHCKVVDEPVACRWFPQNVAVYKKQSFNSCAENKAVCKATVSYTMVSGVDGQFNSELGAAICPSGKLESHQCAPAPAGTYYSVVETTTEIGCREVDGKIEVTVPDGEVAPVTYKTVPLDKYCQAEYYNGLTALMNFEVNGNVTGGLYCCTDPKAGPALPPAQGQVFK